MKVDVFQEDEERRGSVSMDTKMRDRFQQRLSPQLFSSGKPEIFIILTRASRRNFSARPGLTYVLYSDRKRDNHLFD